MEAKNKKLEEMKKQGAIQVFFIEFTSVFFAAAGSALSLTLTVLLHEVEISFISRTSTIHARMTGEREREKKSFHRSRGKSEKLNFSTLSSLHDKLLVTVDGLR